MTDATSATNDPNAFEFDLSALQEAIAHAPDAGFINLNYGQLTVLPQIVSWGKDPNDPTQRVKHARPMIKGDHADDKRGETLELQFSINVGEFNPALTFSYERNIPVRNSTAKDKSDWTEIVEPALIKVLGKDWLKKVVERPYVCVEDVVNCNGTVSKKSKKPLTVPKLIAVYANAAECAAARDKQYGSAAGSAESELTAVVDQVKGLINAMAGDLDEVSKILKTQPPYTNYDADQLLALALAG